MKIEQISKGSFRVRKQYKGKRYTVYFDHKPTAKEVSLAISRQFELQDDRRPEAAGGSLGDYILKYITYKEKTASASTIRGYHSIFRNISKNFKDKNLYDVENSDIQNWINEYSEEHSPKSVRNMYGLIRSTMAKYRPEFHIAIKLPRKENKAEYEPTTRDIERIMEHAQGSRYHIFLQLAALGLRRGEICALTVDDLSDDNLLTINKDLVLNSANQYVIKDHPKTEASNRTILLPAALADQIRAQGYIFRGNPHSVNEYLHRAQDALDIPRFRLHMLRHFCVAYLHKHGFTSEQIMTWGGWETDHVMKRAYRYDLDPAESQTDISAKLGSLF